MRNGKFSVTLLHLFLFIQSFKAPIDLVLTFLPSKKGLKRFTRHWLPVREKRLLVSLPPLASKTQLARVTVLLAVKTRVSIMSLPSGNVRKFDSDQAWSQKTACTIIFANKGVRGVIGQWNKERYRKQINCLMDARK